MTEMQSTTGVARLEDLEGCVRRYQDTRDHSDWQRAMEAGQEFVERIAARLAKRGRIAIADIPAAVSNGNLGLITTLENYDRTCGAAFRTFAAKRVEGSMLDGIRSEKWIPRQNIARSNKSARTAAADFVRYGRAADVTDLARTSGVTIEAAFDSAVLPRVPTCVVQIPLSSFRNSARSEREEPYEIPDRDRTMAEKLNAESFRQMVGKLRRQERLVLTLYYRCDLKLREIGERLGITESRVCQIHKNLLHRLRQGLLATQRRLDGPADAKPERNDYLLPSQPPWNGQTTEVPTPVKMEVLRRIAPKLAELSLSYIDIHREYRLWCREMKIHHVLARRVLGLSGRLPRHSETSASEKRLALQPLFAEAYHNELSVQHLTVGLTLEYVRHSLADERSTSLAQLYRNVAKRAGVRPKIVRETAERYRSGLWNNSYVLAFGELALEVRPNMPQTLREPELAPEQRQALERIAGRLAELRVTWEGLEKGYIFWALDSGLSTKVAAEKLGRSQRSLEKWKERYPGEERQAVEGANRFFAEALELSIPLRELKLALLQVYAVLHDGQRVKVAASAGITRETVATAFKPETS